MEYYKVVISSDDAVVVIHPHRLSVYMRLVRLLVLGLLGVLLLWAFLALFGRVTGSISTSPSSTVPGVATTPVPETLGTVFPHVATTVAAGSPVTTTPGMGSLGFGDGSGAGLLVVMVVLGAFAAFAYGLYLRLVISNHYITISQRQININSALLRRDPQTLPIDRFSDGRYVQPFVSYLLSRRNRSLRWSWGNKFEIDTPGAERNARLDNVPQPTVVMALISQLFRNMSVRNFQGTQRQIRLAQAQYALAADDRGVDPDPELMEPWPAPPTMPAWAERPPEAT